MGGSNTHLCLLYNVAGGIRNNKEIKKVAEKRSLPLCLGGADVRIIPAMMMVQGWDTALTGVFVGLLAAVLYFLTAGKQKKEIPLVPWMGIGCFLVEIFYLFSEKSMI